jgi:cholesterol transport system auxiliary component
MTRIKLFLTLSALWIVSGCTFSNYYVLSTASQPKQSYTHTDQVIGVEKVTVPKYLFKREIAVAESSTQVTFLNASQWAEDMDTGLTHRLIAFLQKKFDQPSVYAYPWGTDSQPDIKVKVHITRFIAQGETVYLDASWEVKSMRTAQRSMKLFSTTVPTKPEASSIVDAMNKAFGALEEDVAKGVREFH